MTPPVETAPDESGGEAATGGADDARPKRDRSSRRKPMLQFVAGTAVSLALFAVFELTSTSVDDVEVGTCFNDAPADSTEMFTEVSEVDAVPCAEPHDNEVFARVDLPQGPDAPYPSLEALGTSIMESCTPHFARYVGIPYEESMLEITALFPTEARWGSGDRETICVLYDGSLRRLEGSMAGGKL